MGIRYSRHLMCVVPSLALVVVAACAEGPAPPWTGQIDSVVIGRSGLPDEFDSVTTFTYVFPSVNADSVLVALLDGGIPVRYGWRALDNLCMDPVGPRFTVQLYRDDARMLDHDFQRGAVGRLLCATQLMRYEVRAGP
jgi:hypothetical protein